MHNSSTITVTYNLFQFNHSTHVISIVVLIHKITFPESPVKHGGLFGFPKENTNVVVLQNSSLQTIDIMRNIDIRFYLYFL